MNFPEKYDESRRRRELRGEPDDRTPETAGGGAVNPMIPNGRRPGHVLSHTAVSLYDA